MKAFILKAGFTLVCVAILPLLGIPAEAARPTKPGGGDTSDPCAASGLDFPAFSYVVPRYSKSTGYENEVRLSDASGACSILVQVVASDMIPPAFAPILVELDSSWRLVWNDSQAGITVLNFSVNASPGQRPVIVPIGTNTISLAGQQATSLNEMPDGGFVYLAGLGNPARSMWRATWNESTSTWVTTQLANFDTDVLVNDIATAPDGQAIYVSVFGDSRDIVRLPLNNSEISFPVDIGGPDDPSEHVVTVPYSEYGAVIGIAAGSCLGIADHTCLAMELHGPNTDPCVPHYYRTLAWDATESSTPDLATLEKLQLAKPSFASTGELVGQLTGSSSKRSCTAKIYDTMIRLSPFSPDVVTTLGTGQVPDAPF